jgi:chitodextrinase
VNSTSVELTWDPPTNEPFGIEGYVVERDGVDVGFPVEAVFIDDTVQPGGSYTYRVRAEDTFENPGEWSTAVVVSTACGEGVLTSVAEPTITITYVRPDTPITGIFDVAVTNLDDPGCEPVVTMVSYYVSGPDFNAYPSAPMDVPVEPGTTGTAQPRAFLGWNPVDGTYVMRTDFLNEVDPAGVSASEILTVVVDTQAPAAPAGLDAQLTGSTTASISWNPASDATTGVAYYEIERNGVIVGTTTGTQYTDPDVSMTARYDFRVRAVDAAGHASGWSNTDFVGCAKCPPPMS